MDFLSYTYWRNALLSLRDLRVLTILLLGFSAGLPLLLIFSTLSLWLREAGVDKSAVTYFSWAALAYSFKFIWAPIVDCLPIPFFSKNLGRRRAWLLLSQLGIASAIIAMGSINPANEYSIVNLAISGLTLMAFAAVALGFSSATQDIVIDAYRIESAPVDMQALLSSAYLAGYRIGMVAAGAGALYLADFFGSHKANYSYNAWQMTYYVMALTVGIGILTTLFTTEPNHSNQKNINQKGTFPYSTHMYLRFVLLFIVTVIVFITVFYYFPKDNLAVHNHHWHENIVDFLIEMIRTVTALSLAVIFGILGVHFGLADQQMVKEGYYSPIKDFFKRYGRIALWVLLLVGCYRLSDIVLGVISNIFYQDLGYSKKEIANVTKVFGLLMTILGSFIGGFLALRYGVMRILLLGAILSSLSNLVFMWLANTDATITALTITITIDNLSAGVAVAAFIAWLSSLTSIEFTATQYAIFSSFMTLFPKLLGGYSGTIVEHLGYSEFFMLTTLLGVPVIALILYLNKNKL